MGKIRGYLNLKPHKDASEQATNYVTDIGSNGIFVHPEGEGPDDTQTPTGWKIADAIELFKSGVSYIKAWIDNNVPKIRVGREDGGHTVIQPSGMDIYGGDGTVNLAHIGYGYGEDEQGGTSQAPFYTFGERAPNSGIGNLSFASGDGVTASGYMSHAEGVLTEATKQCAHAEGIASKALEVASHAEGWGTTAFVRGQHVEGTYNDTTNGNLLHIVGVGAVGAKANGFAVDKGGNARAKGDVYVGCNDDSTGGTKVLSEAKIDTGEHSFSNVSANTYTYIDVTFSKTFATAPQVVAGLKSTLTSANTGNVAVSASNVTTTGFTLRCYNGSSVQKTIYVSWIAVGL